VYFYLLRTIHSFANFPFENLGMKLAETRGTFLCCAPCFGSCGRSKFTLYIFTDTLAQRAVRGPFSVMRLPKPFFGAILPQLQHVFDTAGSTDYHAPGSAIIKSLNLTLTPLYEFPNTNVTGLSALMSIEEPNVEKEEVLVTLPLAIGNVPTARYNADELQATDAAGRLPLRYVDNDTTNERVWMAQRSTQGNVGISFIAYPRNVTRDTPDGPRVDLRRDGGGLNGAGMSFLPSLAEPDQIVKMRVAWDLGNATTNTQGVWTWGDGLVVQREGPASDLVNSFYAVGPVKSYTSEETPGYGMYWFDEPSRFNTTKLAKDVEELFLSMMPFFDDFGASYRVFIRHAYSYGGTATRWSFLVEWSENSHFNPLDLFMLTSHEMVHNWPHIDGKFGDPEWSEAWYIEGLRLFKMCFRLLTAYPVQVSLTITRPSSRSGSISYQLPTSSPMLTR
jgi:hypothetical protein